MILSENISALIQNSFCRCLKHVSSVADMQGNVAEKYVYDPAGNILRKTIAGKTTSYTYDKANQLVSSVCDGKTTHYEYDAAGRLIKEGDKSYSYGWLDKVLAVRENDKKIASFDYQVDGQIAQAIHGDQSEAFFWDGLALIHRGETSFINEPYVTGGNPILSSKDGVMFNDMLGSTLNIGGKAIHMTAFGESTDTNAMYTGKPYIGELGYAFLFRNYRADQGKWQTSDPLGYPDGWNNLAYVNNNVIYSFDKTGLCWWLTPEGFLTYGQTPPTDDCLLWEQCQSQITYAPFLVEAPYIDYDILVYCGETVEGMYYYDYFGSGMIAGYISSISYQCDNSDHCDHSGYIICHITCSPLLKEKIRKYTCGRTEHIAYEVSPLDSPESVTYVISQTRIDTVNCLTE